MVYLFALLAAPALRRILGWAMALMAAAFLVTIPARLWVRYVDRRPGAVVIGLNAASVVILGVVLLAATLVRRRRHSRPRVR